MVDWTSKLAEPEQTSHNWTDALAGTNGPDTKPTPVGNLPELGTALSEKLGPVSMPMEAFKPNGNMEGVTGPQAAQKHEELIKEASRLNRILYALRARSLPQKVQSIHEADPTAKFGTDENGNVYVELHGHQLISPDGEKFYINKPGFSWQDTQNVGREAMSQIPFMYLGGAAGKAAFGTLGRIFGVASGAAAGSINRDLASGVTPDLYNALLSAGTAGAFETFAPLVMNRLGMMIRSAKYFNPKTNQLTDVGKNYLNRMGIDPTDLTPEELNHLKQIVRKADLTKESVALAQQRAAGIPASRGDITGNRSFESAASKGAMGDTAQSLQRGYDAAKQEGITNAVKDAQGGTVESGQGMAAAQARLSAEQQALKHQVDLAYSEARNHGGSVLKPAVERLKAFLGDVFSEKYGPGSANGVRKQLNSLSKLGNDEAVLIDHLEQWRGQLSTISRESSDAMERGAAKRVLKAFDDYMGQFIDDAALKGDTATLQAFKKARGLRAQLGQQFESDKIISAIIDTRDGSLVTTPQEALNMIFTANKLGAKKGSLQAVRKLKDLLGADSEEWKLFKQDAFLRLIHNQKGFISSPDDITAWSGAKYQTALNDALKKNPDVMSELFTPEQIQGLKKLGTVMSRATEAGQAQGVNVSNTDISARALGSRTPLGRVINGLLDKVGIGAIQRSIDVGKLIQANQNPIPFKPPTPPGMGGAASVPFQPEVKRKIANE